MPQKRETGRFPSFVSDAEPVNQKEGRLRRETMGFPLFVYRIAAIDSLRSSMTSARDIDLLLLVFELLVRLVSGERIVFAVARELGDA